MLIMRRTLITFCSLALLPTGVFAQQRAASAAPAMVRPSAPIVARPPAMVSHPVGAAPAHVTAAPRAAGTANHIIIHRTATPVHRIGSSVAVHNHIGANRGGNSNNRDCSVPGLGFDYSHLAAVCGNQAGGPFLGRYASGVGGGYVLFPMYDYVQPSVDVVEDEQQQQAAANTSSDQQPAEEKYRQRPATSYDDISAANTQPQANTPVDNTQYVFVKRDGTLFFAVAYSYERGQLRYITSEGIGRAVSIDTLDLDATQQFNEQRGLSFRSPAA